MVIINLHISAVTKVSFMCSTIEYCGIDKCNIIAKIIITQLNYWQWRKTYLCPSSNRRFYVCALPDTSHIKIHLTTSILISVNGTQSEVLKNNFL